MESFSESSLRYHFLVSPILHVQLLQYHHTVSSTQLYQTNMLIFKLMLTYHQAKECHRMVTGVGDFQMELNQFMELRRGGSTVLTP